jgi:hypothetical protein
MKHVILHGFADDDSQRKRSESRLGRLETGDWVSTCFQEIRICIFFSPGFQDQSVSGAGDSPFTPLEPRSGAERNQNALEIPSTTPPTTTALEMQQQFQVTVISRCKNPFLTSSNLMYLKAGFVCSRQDEVTTRLSLGELFRLECGTVKQT